MAKHDTFSEDQFNSELSFVLSFEAPRCSSNLTPEDSPTSAILKIDKNQMRRQRDRERRNNLSTEQREEINARRRAQYRKHIGQLTADQREERSVERRTLHKNLSPEEEQKHLSMRRASYKTRRMTPCASSIAMRDRKSTRLNSSHPV